MSDNHTIPVVPGHFLLGNLKGEMSLVNIFNIHHNPVFWPDVDEFQPERFLEGNRERIFRHSFIPFGIGQRVCIGNHFALMEATILLAQLVQSFQIRYMGHGASQPKLAISVRPEGGLPMQFVPRQISRQNSNDRSGVA